ncbi:hypothetical protein RUM43_011135 [Polyplax serrata]|uniref:Uncharacterized protein n=1 Tax=Polyplax serrata TaxID=468196 RepID=A0AAN8S3J2_POLSC
MLESKFCSGRDESGDLSPKPEAQEKTEIPKRLPNGKPENVCLQSRQVSRGSSTPRGNYFQVVISRVIFQVFIGYVVKNGPRPESKLVSFPDCAIPVALLRKSNSIE